jgi:hypothetical protein
MKTMHALLAAGLVVTTFGLAVAKLPPPPPMTDAQKEEARAKAAAAAATTAAQLAAAEDRVAAQYFADAKAKGKQVPAPQMAISTPPAPAAKDAKAVVKK